MKPPHAWKWNLIFMSLGSFYRLCNTYHAQRRKHCPSDFEWYNFFHFIAFLLLNRLQAQPLRSSWLNLPLSFAIFISLAVAGLNFRRRTKFLGTRCVVYSQIKSNDYAIANLKPLAALNLFRASMLITQKMRSRLRKPMNGELMITFRGNVSFAWLELAQRLAIRTAAKKTIKMLINDDDRKLIKAITKNMRQFVSGNALFLLLSRGWSHRHGSARSDRILSLSLPNDDCSRCRNEKPIKGNIV